MVLLEEQERNKDDAAEVERRIVGQCRKLARKLDTFDFDGKRATFAAFGMKVEATREDVSIMVDLDPEFTTIEQTLASLSGSKYSFVIVELKEVVVKKRPRVVEWVPC